jgi:hypothetical protein
MNPPLPKSDTGGPVNTSTLSRLAYTAIALTVSACTIGCGLTPVTSTEPLAMPAIKGQVMGGRSPIVNATVRIYNTGANYATGHQLQQTNTDSSGGFSFTGGFTCPAGEFAYITSAAGDTGAGVNNASLLVAALGRCEDLYSGTTYTGTFIIINEISTVAAAYALGNFAAATGTGPGASVNIGAPSTNNATTGTTTAAAGLKHVFENALNLVNPFDGTYSAHSTLPNNSAAAVPQALIHAIGNVIVACVNSNGTATACTNLFSATAIKNVKPQETFTALVNLAQNPTLNATINGSTSTVTVAQFFALATPQTTVYVPTLSAAPADYSIAINYPRGMGAVTGTTQGLQFPTSGALDANDVFYVTNQSGATSTSSNLASFGSDGTLLSFTPNNSATGFTTAQGISVDALGSVYDITTTPATPAVRFTSTAGVLGSTGTSITSASTLPSLNSAVDRANNLWITLNGTSAANLYKVTSAGTAAATTNITAQDPPTGIAVDKNQNIWMLDINASSQQNNVTILENTGTAAAPVYGATKFETSGSFPAKGGTGVTFVTNGANFLTYVSTTTPTAKAGILLVTPTFSGPTVTAATPAAASIGNGTYTSPLGIEADGAGSIWAADNGLSKVVVTVPGATAAFYALAPCLVSGTTCTNPINAPQTVSVDAAGSVWVTSSGGGNLVQIIGTAVPAWPLLSKGVLGMP